MQLPKVIKFITKKYSFLFIALIIGSATFAQPAKPLYVKDTKAENRARLYKSLVSSINKNLSLPLADSTEEYWMDAFYAIELLRYRSPWVESRIHYAFKDVGSRSEYFQQSLLELVHDHFPSSFITDVKSAGRLTKTIKAYAIAVEYLLKATAADKPDIKTILLAGLQADSSNAFLKELSYRLEDSNHNKIIPPVNDLLQQSFFAGAKVVYSFQRKNRNYPGITIIRDSAGNFVKDNSGNIFSVPQLARSISNLPGYISNGNTPQGIFRMDGLEVSKSIFIGPTQNIQLTMPFETSIRHFMNDSTIADSAWTLKWYQQLLPESWKNYFPFFETYYAGQAGRTEIIAHGTTVDPAYYKGQPYYPFTPTLGCLCTKEFWSAENGTRIESDQQKLIDALQKAGGANGYYVVIELNDEQRAVNIQDVLSFLNQQPKHEK